MRGTANSAFSWRRTLLPRSAAALAVLAAGLLAQAEQAPTPAPEQPANPAPADAPAEPASNPGNSVPGNPYQAISTRNPFGLLPPPPPAPPEDTNPAPPPPPPITVKLTGLTDILGNRMAMFLFTEQGAAKAAPKPVTLKEGERRDGVEVLSINFASSTVRLSNNGQMTNVTFTKMEATGGGPGPAAGVPGAPGNPPRIPGMAQPPNASLAPAGAPGGPQASSAAADGGSVIIGGAVDSAPRFGSRGGISSVSSGSPSTPSYNSGGSSAGGTLGGSPVYSSTPGSGITTTAGGAASNPSRPTRTSSPRYTVPMPPELPLPPSMQKQQ